MTKDTLIDILVSLSTFTGSRAMGVSKKDADWDYIVNSDLAINLMYDHELLIDEFVGEEEYDNSLGAYIVDPRNKRKYNFIFFDDPVERDSWLYATRKITNLPKELIDKKSVRIAQFESLCNQYMGNLKKDCKKTHTKEAVTSVVDRILTQHEKEQ